MKEPHELVKSPAESRNPEKLPEGTGTPVSAGYGGYGLNNGVEGEQKHLLDYWRSVRKHLWLVIGVTVLTTMVAAIYMARRPDIYETHARVQVDLENTNVALGGATSNAVVVSNPVGDTAYFNTQLQILTSPGLLRRVVKTLDLEHNRAFFDPLSRPPRSTWQNLQRMVGLGGKDKESEPQDRAAGETPLTKSVAPAMSHENVVEAKQLARHVAALRATLNIEPVKEMRSTVRETRLIDIHISHSDPQIAAKIVNAVADAFVLSNLERMTETSSTASAFLQKRIAELQGQILNGEERLINYAKNHQILSLDANQNTVVERLVGLNRQLLEAENERSLAEAAYRAALVPGAADALAENAAQQTAITEAKLNDLRRQREQLLVETTDEWPEVKDLNRQIAVLEKQVQDARDRATSVVVTNLATRYRQALAREQSLRAAFNQQRGETLSQNVAAISYRILQQEITTNRGLLDGLLQRSRENDVVLARMPNNVRVIDYAIAPDSPVGPRRLRSVAFALMLSLGVGVGLALFLEYLNDTVSSADDVEKLLRLPALAVIPSAASLTRRRLLPGAGASPSRNGSAYPELLVDKNPRSPLAEAYRHLRTSVLLSSAGGAPKTLLVTSSLPSEGKTTTVVNMAISLAQTGATVLLIDADLRRPRIHSIFEEENRRGLSTVLSSEAGQTEVLSVIKKHEASGIFLLTSGPSPPNPAELLGSKQMHRLLGALGPIFTHIIIDSPPVMSFTDSVLLSPIVDGVLLVIHSGQSSRGVVRHSRQVLRDVNAKIFGVVLNNVNLRTDGHYRPGYYDSSHYGADAHAEDADSTSGARA